MILSIHNENAVTATIDSLPLTETVTPESRDQVCEAIRQSAAARAPVYPTGGATSLDFGIPVKAPGVGLSLAGMNRVIDYPARDMTITVEAGMTMTALSETLAAERQRLPIDVPLADRATLGGVIATNWSGALRYGHGTIRDYVIGIKAVDGLGRPFAGGGRVVKNVAGYDFCKLLAGSLGTLGVITQVTLKVVPLAAVTSLVVCDLSDLSRADALLGSLADSPIVPSVVELLVGGSWKKGENSAIGQLAVGLEGSAAEVDWMVQMLCDEWKGLGVRNTRVLQTVEAFGQLQEMTEFPARPAPLVLKASVLPSAVVGFTETVLSVDPDASIAAHAGNGIVIVRFSELAPETISGGLLRQLKPAATAAGGSLIILCCPSGGEQLTRQAVWGGHDAPLELMRSVKNQFDPKNVLNPGRFVY